MSNVQPLSPRDIPHRDARNPIAAFDADLRARNPQWGLRRTADVDLEAVHAGLHRVQRHAMPANNLTLVYRRDPG